MKIEEILKLRGWTEAEIAALAPSLTDPRLRTDLEESYGAVTTELAEMKAKDEAWARQLTDQWQPRVNAAEKEAQDARIALAEAREKLKIAKDYGYLPAEAEAKAEVEAAAARAAQAGAYDPKKHPTFDDVAKFADAEGDAIAMANDLAAEYSYLTGGKSLFEYQAEVNGQTMRGMRALRAESKANRKPDFVAYVAEKFDFAGKRAAMATARQQEHDNAIVKATEERVKNELVTQYGNPLMRAPMVSRAPFIPNKPADGKQPWERGTADQLKNERINRAMLAQAKSAIQ